jgi:hypothetical protein
LGFRGRLGRTEEASNHIAESSRSGRFGLGSLHFGRRFLLRRWFLFNSSRRFCWGNLGGLAQFRQRSCDRQRGAHHIAELGRGGSLWFDSLLFRCGFVLNSDRRLWARGWRLFFLLGLGEFRRRFGSGRVQNITDDVAELSFRL